MSWLLGEHAVDYVKWDMNRELVQPGHQGRAAADAQTRQFYRLLDTLVARFPHIEFESCSSGGGRIDYEVLKRSHRFWASDNNDALERNTHPARHELLLSTRGNGRAYWQSPLSCHLPPA